jgi:glycosyltransferase involved in cell wall biosynthesis
VLIGIDARELCGRPTGVGRYLASLLGAWDRLPEAAGHRFLLYVPEMPPPPAVRLTTLAVEWRLVPSAKAQAGPNAARPAGTTWEQVHLARAVRRDRPGVLFAPAYTAPLSAAVPVVLTVHDLSFVAHPEWFPARTRWRQQVLTTLAAKRARLVLTDSEFSRREIVERLGVTPERVTVVPLGLTGPHGNPRPPAAPSAPVVLFVGSIFTRRHVPELIAAVAAVARRHPDVRLEIVGDNRTHPHQDLEAVMSASGLAGRGALRSYVPDEVLDDLYRSARAFVFLSDYEGFGLTPLEALSSRIPILVGDTEVAREIYGEAADYVATTDEAAIAAAIERLLFDEAARQALLSNAPGVLGRYSWERAARATLAALVGPAHDAS